MKPEQYLLFALLIICGSGCSSGTGSSARLLDAFHAYTTGIESSTSHLKAALDERMTHFEATVLKVEPDRAGRVFEKAVHARRYATELNVFINDVKDKIVKEAGGVEAQSGEIAGRGNTEISRRIMIDGGQGIVLKKRIEDTRSKMLALLDSNDQRSYISTLSVDKRRQNLSWEEENFGSGIPVAAAVATLARIQAELTNTESDIVNKILPPPYWVPPSIDRLEIVAVPHSTYVFPGEEYQASVFLCALDARMGPDDVIVNGRKLAIVDGKGRYSVTDQVPGDKKWSGTLSYSDGSGSKREYSIPEQHYTVAAPPYALVVQDIGNVFYTGVENPVTVSSPYFTPNEISVTISDGEIIADNHHGGYLVNVRKLGRVKISVFGRRGSGKKIPLASADFLVWSFPAPVVKFANKGGGSISAEKLKSQTKIFAILDVFGFGFDAKFNINHFSMCFANPDKNVVKMLEAKSNNLTSEMVALLSTAENGCVVSFFNVIATGPSGIAEPLQPIVFVVQ